MCKSLLAWNVEELYCANSTVQKFVHGCPPAQGSRKATRRWNHQQLRDVSRASAATLFCDVEIARKPVVSFCVNQVHF